MSGGLIVLDWGTTNVRAALLDASGKVLEERQAESGIGTGPPEQLAQRFDKLAQGWPMVPAIAAGMVGSRQGWVEAEYLACPAKAKDLHKSLTVLNHRNRQIAIVPGLKMDGDRHDVMRGEETQIAGFLAQKPNHSGTLVLPGSHSKWVNINNGTIDKFTTYMTGEMFSALANHTILRHSVGIETCSERTSNSFENGAYEASFKTGVGDVFTETGSDLARFFDLRARTLLLGTDDPHSRERLSGLLIGMELNAAAQDGYDVQEFSIIGSGDLVQRYAAAGQVLAAQAEVYEGTSLIWPALFALAQSANLLEGTAA